MPELPTVKRDRELEAAEEEMRTSSERAIAEKKAAALKRIRLKQALSKLIDAAALGYGASKGVEADINTGGDIDTSLDERLMSEDLQTERNIMRDRLAALRRRADQDFRDRSAQADDKYRHDMLKYREDKEAHRLADKDKEAEDRRIKAFQRDNEKKIMSEALRLRKAEEKVRAEYLEDRDEDKYFERMEALGIVFPEDVKKELIEETGWFRSNNVRPLPDSVFTDKAAKNIESALIREAAARRSGLPQSTRPKTVLTSADELP